MEKLLACLPNARKSGDGYRATCPNGHRSRLSLSFRETKDGTVLLKCHSGCSAADVVHALGMELSDLFEKPIYNKPVDTAQARLWKKQKQWRAVFDFLPLEVRIAAIAAEYVRDGKPLSDEDHERFLLAVKRIEVAKGALCGY